MSRKGALNVPRVEAFVGQTVREVYLSKGAMHCVYSSDDFVYVEGGSYVESIKRYNLVDQLWRCSVVRSRDSHQSLWVT